MLREIEAKTILNKAKQQDSWFLDMYTVNPYSACAFNCLYCYIRGSKYGEHMDSSMAVKVNAVELLRKQLSHRARKGQYGFIVFASATDPYVKPEADLLMTRRMLEVILEMQFPVHMITKSDMILRDLDLLHAIHEQSIVPAHLKDRLPGGAIVSFSFSTLDDKVGRIFEPGAPPPYRRLEALKAVRASGLVTGVSLMPLIPFVSDTGEQLEGYFRTFQEAGADYLLPATLTLFGNDKADSKTLMMRAIRKHYPELEKKYEKLFGQADYLPRYYTEAFQRKMGELFAKYGMNSRIPDCRSTNDPSRAS